MLHSYLETSHGTVLGFNNKILYHAPLDDIPENEIVKFRFKGSQPLLENNNLNILLSLSCQLGHYRIALKGADGYASAQPNSSRVEINREQIGPWEIFQPGNLSVNESIRFGAEVNNLCERNAPILLHFGPGTIPKDNFLNIDIRAHSACKNFITNKPDKFFQFPFADEKWPIPDNCVDYIFHEDFIEHIPQLNQLMFLAESLRVLKPGGIHRINTPCLKGSMQRHSDFSKGLEGVYQGELKWGHISLLTKKTLRELSKIIGYKNIIFTRKSQGTSPFAVDDVRPGPDRDDIKGNLYADLIK